MPDFVGKVIFLENYNMNLASLLVSGVDVWLNTPARPLEASGTSGIKAVMNGVLNLSVLDGWWAEAWREDAGWGVSEKETYQLESQQNQLDAYTIYSILENDLIPLYFDDNEVMSGGWIKKVRNTLKFIAPHFTMQRMLSEYVVLYKGISDKHNQLKKDGMQGLKDLINWERKVYEYWSNDTSC